VPITWAMDVCEAAPAADVTLHSALAALPVVLTLPLPAGGAPAGMAVAQAWPVGGDGATAASAMDVDGLDGVEGSTDLDGVNESESPETCSELACGCGYGYTCSGHRLTRARY
jgi:hypothetical protein